MEFKELTERCKQVNIISWIYKIIQNFFLGLTIAFAGFAIYYSAINSFKVAILSIVGTLFCGIVYFLSVYFYRPFLHKIIFKEKKVFYVEILKNLPSRILKQPTEEERLDAVNRIVTVLTKICEEAFYQSKTFAEIYYEKCTATMVITGFILTYSPGISYNTYKTILTNIEKFINGESFKR